LIHFYKRRIRKRTISNSIITLMMFSSVKYFMTGDLKPNTVGLLESGGARRLSYLSSIVTHCIVGDKPQNEEMGEAEEVFEVPVVTEEWVTSSTRCGHLLPVRGFSSSSSQLFRGVTMVMDMGSMSKADCDKLWAMVTWYGGRVVGTVREGGTHLVCGGWRNDLDNLGVTAAVTPAWVIDSVKNSERVNENEYHPSLFWKAPEGEKKNRSQPDGSDSLLGNTGYSKDDLLDVTEQWGDTASLTKKDEEYYEDYLDETIAWDKEPCQVGKIKEEEGASYENVSATKEVEFYDHPTIVIKIEVSDAVPEPGVSSGTISLDPEVQNSSCSTYSSAVSMLRQESDITSTTSEYFSQSSGDDSTKVAGTNKIMTNNNEVKVDGIYPLAIFRPKRSSSMSAKEECPGMKTSSLNVTISKSTSLSLIETISPIEMKRERKRKFSEERSSSFPFNKCSSGPVKNPVKKLKVEDESISSVSPVSRRWSESDKFRKGYSRAEVMALINFFKEQGLYFMKSGTQVWKIIEKASICPGRSWQSLKSFFLKYVVPQLPSFGATEKELDDQARRINDMGRWRFGEGSSRNVEIVASFYSMAEDKKILNYIIDLGRVEEVGLSLGGNRFWKMLEKKSVVVGRSWQSMKERFRKKIVKNLDNYGLSDSDMDFVRHLL